MMRVERDIANAKNSGAPSTTGALSEESPLSLPSVPLVFMGHSRGAKHSILAAQAMKRAGRNVAGLVLLDPVDATQFEAYSVLPVLRSLGVPTAIVGAGAEEGACAPPDADYDAFFRVLGESGTPRLLAEVAKAGHMQFLDSRKTLVVDPCTVSDDTLKTATRVPPLPPCLHLSMSSRRADGLNASSWCSPVNSLRRWEQQRTPMSESSQHAS